MIETVLQSGDGLRRRLRADEPAVRAGRLSRGNADRRAAGTRPLATMAMLLPLTFYAPPEGALIMLAVSNTRSIWRLHDRHSGEPAGRKLIGVTCIDGYQMARQGRAGSALAIAALGSFFAGTVATVAIALFAPALSQVGPRVPARRLLLPHAAGPHRCDGARTRFDPEGIRDGVPRPASRARWHGREHRHPALRLRLTRSLDGIDFVALAMACSASAKSSRISRSRMTSARW